MLEVSGGAVAHLGQRERRRQYSLGRKAGIGRAKTREALDQQASANEQRQGDGSLGDDQR